MTLDIFKFKTDSRYFEKERDGIKNNTVREIDLNDSRFIKLITYHQIGWNKDDIFIELYCEDVHPFRIVRSIRDISIWNNLMVITWEHEEGKK